MATFKNFEQFEKDGKAYERYTRINAKGKEEVIEEPYILADGSVNSSLLNLMTAHKGKEISDAASKKASDRANMAANIKKNVQNAVESEFGDNESVPTKKEIAEAEQTKNPGWFKRNGKTALKMVGLGLAGLALGLKVSGSVPKINVALGNQPTPASTVSEEVVESAKTDAEKQVEGAVTYISYEDAVEDMAIIGKEWQKLGYDSVSQRSLNSLYFATNYDMFEEDTISKMTENNVVSSDPMVIIADSLESLSVCSDQGSKELTGQDKNLIDMTMFCVRDEDKKLVTHAYESLQKMGNDATDEQAQGEFESYYHYLCNEEDLTNFPIIYNEADKGVNYLMNQAYGPIFCVAGGQHSVSQSELDYLENNTGMNDFSSVIKEMENCLDKAEEVKNATDEQSKALS